MAEPEFELSGDVAHREIEGQILLLTPNDDVLYTLNDSGRLAWEMLLVGAGVAEIASRMAETYRLPPEDARGDVVAFLADLERLGVVRRRP